MAVEKKKKKSLKKLLDITNKIKITPEANESILRARECTLRYAQEHIMCLECNSIVQNNARTLLFAYFQYRQFRLAAACA